MPCLLPAPPAQGQLGDGTHEPASAPVPVTGNLTFRAISAGLYTACGIANDGAAYCCERTLLLKPAHMGAEPAVALVPTTAQCAQPG